MSWNRILPFKRGDVHGSDGLLGDGIDKLEGQVYAAPDSVHGYGGDVLLRCVKNDSSAALTVARKCVEFSANAGDLGRRVVGICDTAGAVAKPIDDAYKVGSTIPARALFWVVEQGFCDVLNATQATATTLAVGSRCTVDATGRVAYTEAVDEAYILGIADEKVATTNTAIRVYVESGLAREGS